MELGYISANICVYQSYIRAYMHGYIGIAQTN